jgi:hypothetical protein
MAARIQRPGAGKRPLGVDRRQLTNAAVWVPTVNDREVEIVSKRLHNYEYNQYGDSSPTRAGSANPRPWPRPMARQIRPF